MFDANSRLSLGELHAAFNAFRSTRIEAEHRLNSSANADRFAQALAVADQIIKAQTRELADLRRRLDQVEHGHDY